MNISIFGLGYVGTVCSGCFAQEGHFIIGVDKHKSKVDMINDGISPVIEIGLNDIIESEKINKNICATQNAYMAVMETDISMVCVGTPSNFNGSLDLKYVHAVCKEIGFALKYKCSYHVVVIRSTMLPGSLNKVVIPTLEKYSDKKAFYDFGVCINPEFLREGSAVNDFFNPPKIVIGACDSLSSDTVMKLYQNICAPKFVVNINTAEMIKYTDNAWHALKVVFANEIGSLCDYLNLDSHEVMDLFCHDVKLNISSAYLRPGLAFGGSCLPKDLRALCHNAKELDLDLPLLNNILISNRAHIIRLIRYIVSLNKKNIGILGFSFKTGTDDLRESPMIEIIEWLLGKGYNLRLYDKNVLISSLIGANKEYIIHKIPHISNLLVNSINKVIDNSDIIIIGNYDKEYASVLNYADNHKHILNFYESNKHLINNSLTMNNDLYNIHIHSVDAV